MLHGVEFVGLLVPRQTHNVARAGGVADSVFLRLVGFGGIKLPDARVPFQYRARIHAFAARDAVFFLARIGRRAKVYVQFALVVQGQRFGAVFAVKFQAGHDGFGLGIGGHRAIGTEFVAVHRTVGRGVQIAIADFQARAGIVAKIRCFICFAVLVGVFEQRNAAVLLQLAEFYQHIAVGSHRQVAGFAHAVGHGQRAKAFGQFYAAIVRIGFEQRGGGFGFSGNTIFRYFHAGRKQGNADQHSGDSQTKALEKLWLVQCFFLFHVRGFVGFERYCFAERVVGLFKSIGTACKLKAGLGFLKDTVFVLNHG